MFRIVNGMKQRIGHVWVTGLLCWMMSIIGISSAYAQSFSNTAVGNIDNNTLCPGATGVGTTANLTRNIVVSGLGSVTDLNVGFLATHTWRGDIRLTLTSPAPSSISVVLITTDTNNTGNDDDYNIELGDEAAETVNTGAQDGPNDTTAPIYQFLVSPNNALAAFNGISNPNGTWVMTMCDDYQGESGQFLRGELFFQFPSGADLSLNVSANDTTPEIGSTVLLTYTVANGGPNAATNVTTQITLPAGLSYTGQTGSGSYNNISGAWTLPTPLANGSTTSITIDATVLPIGPYTIVSEVSASDQSDGDSTPNNGVTTEDDYKSITLFPVPSTTPPGLNCPIIDQFSLVWDAPGTANGWTAGALTNSYTAGGIAIDFAMTGDTGQLAQSGGNNTPITSTAVTGGISPADYGVAIAADYTSTAQNVLLTIDLNTAGDGVEGVQFPIFDVDLGGWTDLITVNGTLGGTAVTPILTSGAQNTVIGTNQVQGTGGASNTTNQGNMYATFLSPVDQVTFTYGNGPLAGGGTDPDFQIIKLHTLTMCPRLLADLTAEKSVAPVVPGAYMTPGNEILYTITVVNSAAATADANAIDLSDTLPDTVKFVSATTTGFTGGAFGTPALPPANTDCTGGACVIHYSGATLPINTTGEIIVTALIK